MVFGIIVIINSKSSIIFNKYKHIWGEGPTQPCLAALSIGPAYIIISSLHLTVLTVSISGLPLCYTGSLLVIKSKHPCPPQSHFLFLIVIRSCTGFYFFFCIITPSCHIQQNFFPYLFQVLFYFLCRRIGRIHWLYIFLLGRVESCYPWHNKGLAEVLHSFTI